MDADELLKRYAAGERNFHEANLVGASLSEAFLSHICLVCANLKDVNFASADLSWAKLIGANLDSACLLLARPKWG